MEVSQIISSNHIIPASNASTKKLLLQELAGKCSELYHLNQRDVFNTLMEREQLGTTGVGRGVAIPHGKLMGLQRVVGLFARLERAIDYDAIDGEPVDLAFLLLAPPDAGADHLRALARISRILRDPVFCDKLRGSQETYAIYSLLNDHTRSNAA